MDQNVKEFEAERPGRDLTGALLEKIRDLEASQRVTEMLLAQVFMRLGHATGNMEGFVATVFDNMELDIRRTIEMSDARNRDAALDVAEYFDSLRGRLTGMMPRERKVN